MTRFQDTLQALLATAVVALALASGTPAPARAEADTTRILVRAQAHDAKIIGSNVGGARITVRDAASGALLAEGVQTGSTGDTGRLVGDRPRRGAYDTDGAAGYVAELALDRPTLVDITATGPLGPAAPEASTTKRMLVVPGQDVLGDGVVLELNGLTVTVPGGGPEVRDDGSMRVRARVTMLCGCPIEPGGLWDAAEFTVEARLVDAAGATAAQGELAWGGEESRFEGVLEAPAPGDYRLEVLALQPAAGNFGRAAIDVAVP